MAGERILVCDDDPQILRALRLVLRGAGKSFSAGADLKLLREAAQPTHRNWIQIDDAIKLGPVGAEQLGGPLFGLAQQEADLLVDGLWFGLLVFDSVEVLAVQVGERGTVAGVVESRRSLSGAGPRLRSRAQLLRRHPEAIRGRDDLLRRRARAR